MALALELVPLPIAMPDWPVVAARPMATPLVSELAAFPMATALPFLVCVPYPMATL
jgi:hypothetical protein